MTPLIAKSSRTGASEPVIDAEGPPPVCDEHDDEADKEGLILTRLPGNVAERQHVIGDQDQSGSRGDARARAEQQRQANGYFAHRNGVSEEADVRQDEAG